MYCINILYGNGSSLNQVVTLPTKYETKYEVFEALCELSDKFKKEGFKRTYQQGFYHWFKNYETDATRGIFVTNYKES